MQSTRMRGMDGIAFMRKMIQFVVLDSDLTVSWKVEQLTTKTQIEAFCALGRAF